MDGPGIRTTVFFKGCALRCRWCHNPESQRTDRELMIFENKCVHCGHCKEVCPQHGERCTLCGTCALLCPADARKLCGRKYTTGELLDVILQDKPYYDNSGGGVTLSGGECLLFPEFAAELLRACSEAGVHTAADTSGFVPWENIECVLPFTDLFLYDVKCISEELHAEGTGSGNRLILDNLRRLSDETDKDIIIRVPLIPGFNDSDDELGRIGAFLAEIRVKRIDVLPYHRMGEHKYAALGRPAECFDVPSAELLEKAKRIISG